MYCLFRVFQSENLKHLKSVKKEAKNTYGYAFNL